MRVHEKIPELFQVTIKYCDLKMVNKCRKLLFVIL